LFLSKRSPQVVSSTPSTPSAPSTGSSLTARDVFTMYVYMFASAVTQFQPGKIPPPSKVPEVMDTQVTGYPEFPGAKRRKIRYGPYRIPSNAEKTFESMVLQEQGLISTTRFAAKKPCEGYCTILKMEADMEYDDGTTADTKTGAWFHHAVLVNVGRSVKDPVCNGAYMENVFMSSKERNPGLFFQANSSVKTGYHVLPEDSFVLTTELMNMDNKDKWLWVTMTYDYIDGDHPELKDGKVIWMSLSRDMCGTVPKNPFGEANITDDGRQPLKMIFGEHSIPWEVPYDAQLLGTNGHMHDGATSMEVFHNSELICTSVPKYAYSSTGGMGMPGGGTSGSGGHSHGRRQLKPLMGGNYTNKDIEHISQQLPCIHEPPLSVKKGDKMFIVANYDFNKHPGMKNDKGEIDDVMGIAGSIFALPYPRQ